MSLFDEQGNLKDNKLEGLVDNLPSAGLVGNSDTEPSDFDSSLDESLVSDIGLVAGGQTAANTMGSPGPLSSQGTGGTAAGAAIAGGAAYALEDDIADDGPADDNSVDNTDSPDRFAGAGAERAGTDPTDRLPD